MSPRARIHDSLHEGTHAPLAHWYRPGAKGQRSEQSSVFVIPVARQSVAVTTHTSDMTRHR